MSQSTEKGRETDCHLGGKGLFKISGTESPKKEMQYCYCSYVKGVLFCMAGILKGYQVTWPCSCWGLSL